MENKIGIQLRLFIVLLGTVWIMLLLIQIRLATRYYSNQKDLFEVKLTEVFNESLSPLDTADYRMIDSLIGESLRANNINYAYDLGVYSDDEGEFLFLTEDADTEAMLENGFQFKLLSLDDEDTRIDTIYIHFPGLVHHFRFEMIFGYVIIIFMLLLLLICFINFFYIILKQRSVIAFKEKMAHFITHELKTPLTTINLSTQLLKDESVNLDEEAKSSYLNVITEETHVLETLVEEVLTVFQLDSVPISDMVDVSMHKVIEEVCRVHAPQLNRCGGEVFFDFKAEDDVVTGNFTHLFNAISNLIDNAIKYRKDKLRIDIGTKTVDKAIQISIQDNGIGIKKENLPLIFEPFARFNAEDAYYVKGFGLGLDYVKHIVEFHKGSVSVISKLGFGTTFYVTLPLKNK